MKTRNLIWVLVAAIMVAVPGFAQVQKGSITVTVVDADGSALPGATVTAQATDSITRRSEVTDERGIAELNALDSSASYMVAITLEGFAYGQADNVRVTSGQNSAVKVTLSLATLTESI